MAMLKFHLITYGCQMNVHDSEGLAGVLASEGWLPAEDENGADIILVNTCAVRSRPERKATAKLGALSRRKRDGSLRVLGISGCMAQEHGAELLDRFPELDFVMGTGSLTSAARLVGEALAGERRCELSQDGDVGKPVPRSHGSRYRAYVDAIYGCTNFCSYCIVPYVRGPERSRPLAEIVAEVADLASRGWVEVTLLGQNVNAYGKDLGAGGSTFAALLREVDAIDGIRRVRFTTSHPKDCGTDLLEAVAELPGVCEHLHLPAQAGDDRILAAMNRGYPREGYVGLARRARGLIPGVSITTDLIVGFPGEGRAEFRRTLDLLEEVRFDQAFMFVYTPRPGTAAAGIPDPAPRAQKVEWLQILAARQKEVAREINQELVGQRLEVLVDGPSPEDHANLAGRTRTNKLVVFPARPGVAEGDFVEVVATGAKLWGFEGMLRQEGEQ
jgi:tRNA-2-methylthio-N6-dimethylallyladenosine synthase